MLFKRYASPMTMLDKMIQTGRFLEFVCEFIQIQNDEMMDQTRWEFFLHKVFNMTFQEYLAQTEGTDGAGDMMTQDALEATVKESVGIISGFCPS